MTIVEAAAFGAPTLLDQSGFVGAASRLRPSHGESFAAPFADTASPVELAGAAAAAGQIEPRRSSGEMLLAVLADAEALAVVGRRAQARALEWDSAAFGGELAAILETAAAERH
jgi:hypothetical protein